MKKILSLCLALAATTPTYASVSQDLQNLVDEKTEYYTVEHAHAYAYSKMIIAGKVPVLSGMLLSRMQANVTTSKPAIARLCDDILTRKLKWLYPYVQDNFATISDYIVLNHGFFNASSWNAVEEMLRHGLTEFYEFIPDWARGIDEHAASDEILFFQRLFIRRVI